MRVRCVKLEKLGVSEEQRIKCEGYGSPASLKFSALVTCGVTVLSSVSNALVVHGLKKDNEPRWGWDT